MSWKGLNFKWLYPGLKIKRWILLGAFGISLIIAGGISLLDISSKFKTLTPQPFGSILLLFPGLGFGLIGFHKTLQFIDRMTGSRKDWPGQVIQERQLERGPRIVAIGGGTGLSSILRGLKKYTSNITAIVTVADDGGSSGVLRDQMGILPPGDIRNCLVALADTEPLMEQLFQYRFSSGEGLKGHSFGNLFIATLTDLLGDFEEAVKESSKVLAIRGCVLPSTLDDVILRAEFVDGTVIEGESVIPGVRKRIKRIELQPEDNRILPEAERALLDADMIIIGPGSLYTSIIPNLLVGGMVEAISRSNAVKVYICNIMTQAGETDGYTASEHVRAILDHAGKERLFDYIVVNESEIEDSLVEKYKQQESYPVKVDDQQLANLGLEIIAGNLVTEDKFIRHDSDKLACLLLKLLLNNGRYKRGRFELVSQQMNLSI